MRLPPKFVEGVLREQGEPGRSWLDALPQKLDHYEREWGLSRDAGIWHGYLGLVLAVRWQGQPAVLKLSWVDEDTCWEARALQEWAGRGAVQLWNRDEEGGALLLERLDPAHSLETVELEAATRSAAKLLRRLAIETTHDIGSSIVELWNLAQQRWERLGQPFPREWLALPSEPYAHFLVHQDLHFGNVLAGQRERWLAIDPKVIRGDLEFGVAPLLWSRTDQGKLSERLAWIVQEARLDRLRALQWTLFRALEYWLWALEKGLDDVPRELAEWAASELRLA